VNQDPTASAGNDTTIVLPVNSAVLRGSAIDPDGAISSYAWTKISGPAAGTIATPAAAITALNNLVQGLYRYRLTVTDNNGASATNDVYVQVNAALSAQSKLLIGYEIITN
jgi:hypothetical protein